MKQYLTDSWLLLAFIVGFTLLVGASSCATHAPANLSPEAQQAWYGTRVIKALDVLRDTAIEANAQTPPLLSEAVTRRIVQTHASALQTVRDAPRGWQMTVSTALTELERRLPRPEAAIVHPYLELTRTLVKEFPHD
jgi:hypothetical protein